MKKELILPIAIIGLTIAFGVICFLVFISGGTPSLIKKKMRIGALLLTFNAMVFGASSCNPYKGASCYLSPPEEPAEFIFLGTDFSYNATLNRNFPGQITELSPKNINRDFSSNGFGLGLNYYQYFGKYKNPYSSRNSLIFNLNFKLSPGYDKKSINDSGYVNQIIQQGTSKIDTLNFVRFNGFSTLNLGIMYNYNLVAGLWLNAGVDFDIQLTENYKEYLSFDHNQINFRQNLPIVRLEDSNKTAVLYDGKLNGVNMFNLGMNFGMGYEIRTDDNIDFIPYINYHFGLLNWKNDWKINSINIGCRIRFDIMTFDGYRRNK